MTSTRERLRFGEWPRARTVPLRSTPPTPPAETYYVISALDGAIATAATGERATHG